MSDLINSESLCKRKSGSGCSAIKIILEPVDRDLGGFSVRRLLPTKELPSVGPFIFFDHLGPAVFESGSGIDVRPHPHIGLATITYVFSGEIFHRDSLGHKQSIRADEINWMTAGKGISHSERTPPELRQQGHTLEALQLWVALPEADQQTEPFFAHYAAEALPLIESAGRRIRVMIGEAYGAKSAVKTHSKTLYVEVYLAAGEKLVIPNHVEERAVYVVSGSLSAQASDIDAHSMVIFDETPDIELVAKEETRLVIIGGAPLGKRTVWWNLVSTNPDLIEQAKKDWRNKTFPGVPGEREYIPVPKS
jgi:redox-sensitive bicupin YhaK (pirin superfamily)